MSFRDDMALNEWKFHDAWRTLKRQLIRESKMLDQRIRCAKQVTPDDLFTRCVIEPDENRKLSIDAIIEYMNDAEDEM